MDDDYADPIDPVEDCPWLTPRAILARYGFSPLPPDALTDRQLPGRLWELLYAAAARRFFFHFTDHLSDSELYRLLWEQWLDEPATDIPLEAETNTNVPVCDFPARGMSAEEIDLRYYADAADVEHWRTTEPGFSPPPHEDPPYDRDRFLPTAPIPRTPPPGWLPDGEDDSAICDPHWPGMGQDDSELPAGSDAAPGMPSLSEFEAQLKASDPENWIPPAETFARENVPFLPPAEVTDETLTPILWELLHNLAVRSLYLLHTDHLSDRELYTELWSHALREPASLAPRDQGGAFFHDFLGSWGADDMPLWLRFYATDTERAQHARDWPEDKIPPGESPPFNRDWRLPKAPFS
jgi:hypothetical protein